MNQILDYNPISDGENRRNGGGFEKNKIILFFSIALIVFAVLLIGIGIYNKKQNNSKDNAKPSNTDAKISTLVEGATLKISVSHDKNLKKLVYNWNTDAEKTMSITTGKTFETVINIPAGDNTLNIQVTDEDGQKHVYSKPIYSEEGVDIVDPTNELNVTDDKKLEIKVKDETAIDFFTYRWNDEDEIKVEAEDDEKLQMLRKIDIKEGKNSITVVAVDKANNTESKMESYEGLNQPIIVVVLSEDKSKLVVTCSHENGVSKIEYTLNGKPYAAELPDSPKEITFEQALDRGENEIIITATSIDKTTTTFGGRCSYMPEQDSIVVE